MITTRRYVIAQKSADLISIAAEDWSHGKYATGRNVSVSYLIISFGCQLFSSKVLSPCYWTEVKWPSLGLGQCLIRRWRQCVLTSSFFIYPGEFQVVTLKATQNKRSRSLPQFVHTSNCTQQSLPVQRAVMQVENNDSTFHRVRNSPFLWSAS
jgi:hypothetical protein